jgi:uncharacterized protein (TIGR03382 family)
MTSDTVHRSIWWAAGIGLMIAIVEMLIAIVASVALDAFGPAPSGYAGAAFGAAIVTMFGIGLAIAAVLGLLTGAVLFRRRRSQLVMWSSVLLVLFTVIAPLFWVLMSSV